MFTKTLNTGRTVEGKTVAGRACKTQKDSRLFVRRVICGACSRLRGGEFKMSKKIKTDRLPNVPVWVKRKAGDLAKCRKLSVPIVQYERAFVRRERPSPPSPGPDFGSIRAKIGRYSIRTAPVVRARRRDRGKENPAHFFLARCLRTPNLKTPAFRPRVQLRVFI